MAPVVGWVGYVWDTDFQIADQNPPRVTKHNQETKNKTSLPVKLTKTRTNDS